MRKTKLLTNDEQESYGNAKNVSYLLKKKMEKKLQKPYLTDYNLLIAKRFMASLLSNLDNNVAEGIHKLKRKYGHYNKKCETYGIKIQRLRVLP